MTNAFKGAKVIYIISALFGAYLLPATFFAYLYLKQDSTALPLVAVIGAIVGAGTAALFMALRT